jgi:hypothetical protein
MWPGTKPRPVCTPSCAQVEGGDVHLANQTLLAANQAPDGQGKSIHLLSGTLDYTLPAPLGHWLLISHGATFRLDPGAVDSSFPYSCAAGVVGGPSVTHQSRQECWKPW